MATGSIELDNSNERWKRAIVGPLSTDFLRLSTSRDIQEQADRQAAIALYQQQQMVAPYMAPNIVGRLSITVAQAKLVKNYGMVRMDPYVRLRVGHYVYETQTDPNGGKTPRWNRVVHCQLPTGVNTMYVEIYDECSFTMDELIAYTEVKIPDSVIRGETHEDWYPLSGKQGEGVEGMIDLVLSFTTVAASPSYLYQPVQPVVMVPNVAGRAMPVFISPAQPQVAPIIQQLPPPSPVRELNEEELKQIEEMFPNLDKEVIKSIVMTNNGNKDATINSLLQMTSP